MDKGLLFKLSYINRISMPVYRGRTPLNHAEIEVCVHVCVRVIFGGVWVWVLLVFAKGALANCPITVYSVFFSLGRSAE